MKDIEIIERVQRNFTRRLPGFGTKSYQERLKLLNLQSLEERRLIRDIIMVYKIVNNLVNLKFDDFFEKSRLQNTRGNSCKLYVKRTRLELRRHSFCTRVVPVWNSLTDNIIMCGSLRNFKLMLSKIDFRRFLRGDAHLAGQSV